MGKLKDHTHQDWYQLSSLYFSQNASLMTFLTLHVGICQQEPAHSSAYFFVFPMEKTGRWAALPSETSGTDHPVCPCSLFISHPWDNSPVMVMDLEVTRFGRQELIDSKGKEKVVVPQSLSTSPNTAEIHPLDQQYLESYRGGREMRSLKNTRSSKLEGLYRGTLHSEGKSGSSLNNMFCKIAEWIRRFPKPYSRQGISFISNSLSCTDFLVFFVDKINGLHSSAKVSSLHFY